MPRKSGKSIPKFWKYSEGANHAANEMAVSGGQVDMATDFDRNRNAMIEAGSVKPDANKMSGPPIRCPTTRSLCWLPHWCTLKPTFSAS